MRRYGPIGLILIAFLVIGTLFALLTPDWQAPDEPAHYNYISQLASGDFPLIEPGDYDQEYQSQVISSGFDSQYSIDPFRYEDYQPPLYYLLQTPVFWLFDGSLEALRLTSVVLGAVLVLLTYLIAVRIFPDKKWLAIIAAAFAAFLPQHVAMLSAVNNDSLAELIIAGIILILISIILPLNKGSSHGGETEIKAWKWLFLGVLLGLGFITKVTVYILVPVTALTVVWLYWGHWKSMGRTALMVFGPAFAVGLIWWLRNIIVYEAFDPLGNFAHNAVVVGQPRSQEWIQDFGLSFFLRSFARTTFQSFWGQFGWMGVPMPNWVYTLLLLFSIIICIGLVWTLVQQRKRNVDGDGEGGDENNNALAWSILIALFFLSLITYIGYNITFVQHQGRYLFPALIPISLAVALGAAAILSLISTSRPNLQLAAALFFALALFALDILALFNFIIPSLT